MQNTPRQGHGQGLAATQQGCSAPNQGWGRYFMRLQQPESHPTHPQCAPPKSLSILLWASRFLKISPKIGLFGPLAPPPRSKMPNKGWGHTFMNVFSAPTKSGNEWLTHPKALGPLLVALNPVI